jgi:hypothetical protein
MGTYLKAYVPFNIADLCELDIIARPAKTKQKKVRSFTLNVSHSSTTSSKKETAWHTAKMDNNIIYNFIFSTRNCEIKSHSGQNGYMPFLLVVMCNWNVLLRNPASRNTNNTDSIHTSLLLRTENISRSADLVNDTGALTHSTTDQNHQHYNELRHKLISQWRQPNPAPKHTAYKHKLSSCDLSPTKPWHVLQSKHFASILL